jgi:hypothetical protein
VKSHTLLQNPGIRRNSLNDRFAFADPFALIHFLRSGTGRGAPPRTGPASARAAPLAARATSMPPSRSAVKARKMRDAREEARGTTPACGTYDDMRYVSCRFVRVSSKCHLVQSDVIMALLSFVFLRVELF